MGLAGGKANRCRRWVTGRVFFGKFIIGTDALSALRKARYARHCQRVVRLSMVFMCCRQGHKMQSCTSQVSAAHRPARMCRRATASEADTRERRAARHRLCAGAARRDALLQVPPLCMHDGISHQQRAAIGTELFPALPRKHLAGTRQENVWQEFHLLYRYSALQLHVGQWRWATRRGRY